MDLQTSEPADLWVFTGTIVSQRQMSNIWDVLFTEALVDKAILTKSCIVGHFGNSAKCIAAEVPYYRFSQPRITYNGGWCSATMTR